jgi:putative membrane protein
MLGVVPMESMAGMEPETMSPLLTGLFGIPSLLWQGGAEIPPQYDDETVPVSPSYGVKGVLTGCVTGWFPGITSTAGAMIAGRIFGNGDTRGFISMVSSIGTASAMFAFITLSLTGKERSGTMSAINSLVEGTDISLGSVTFTCILVSMGIAAVLGYIITVWSGKRMCTFVQRLDMNVFNRAILVLMIILTIVFCGYWGLVVLAACTLIGMAPLVLDIRRIHLTGCLIVPVLLFKLGLF